jgi:transcriptional regulator with XRE-family HTH domain
MGDFAAWLNTEMEEQGLSFQQVAQRVGLSDTVLTGIMDGQMRPSADLCQRIAIVFDVPPEEVLGHAGLLPLKPSEMLLIRETVCFHTQPSPEQ